MAVAFYIHKMSEHMQSAEIIQWLAAEGEPVAQYQPLVEVMTDKFTVEVEAPQAGILAGIRPGCEPGAAVPVGEPIAFIVQPGETAPVLPPFGAAAPGSQPPAPVTPDPGSDAPAGADGGADGGRARSTPVARRMAKDLGVDIEQLRGSGPGGRVVEADIRAAARQALPAQSPTVQPAPLPPAPPQTGETGETGGFRWQELTPIQRITGERMRESVVNAPQFALEVSADATNLLWLQEALGDRVTLQARARLSLTGLLVKIVAAVLPQHPRANAHFVDGKIKLFDAANIGVAVGGEQGLVVPVIKDAGHKTLAAVTAELAAFQAKARTLHFSPDDLAGATFTLSNLGMAGVERFTAIVNPPQSAILAVGAVSRQPVVLPGDLLGVRPLLHLTLTADHRVLDGLQAARLLAELKEKIEKPYFVID